MASKYDFNHISLMWRPARGHRRIQVGTLSVSRSDNSLTFAYNDDGVREARKVDASFCGFPGLPLENRHFSSQQVKEVFFGRLINGTRNDAGDFYDFWLVDKKRLDDPLYILAQTQGLSFLDMFEFVPGYFSSHRHSFITDVAGLSKSKFDLEKLRIGDSIGFEREPDNEHDRYAVSVNFGGETIGYIKKGHNIVVNRKNTKGIRLTVWSLTTLKGFEKLYLRVDIN